MSRAEADAERFGLILVDDGATNPPATYVSTAVLARLIILAVRRSSYGTHD